MMFPRSVGLTCAFLFLGQATTTIAAPPPTLCNRRAHWDERYYIQVVPGLGEIKLPCPAGTVYVGAHCSCDFRNSNPVAITPNSPRLCEGCLIVNGVGFNPFPGDCTKYLDCWTKRSEVKYLVRACPFGQYWDADTITCRPSFLVKCTADPCKNAIPGFTYGYTAGCWAYWKCIDKYSVAHCCPEGGAYVKGMGCLTANDCNDACPPDPGIVA